MSNNARDTQFQGFAKLLWDELVQANSYGYIDVTEDDDGIDPTNYKQLIARRAYDLVLHTVENVDMVDLARLFRQEIAERIPDLTELPKGQYPMEQIEAGAERMLRAHDPNGPIKLTFNDGNKRYEGIAFYKGDVKEQE